MIVPPGGYVARVTSDQEMTRPERTAAAMHDTAEQLEEAEAVLHCSADRSPNAETTGRLHGLGDDVTARTRDIDRRADGLTNSG
jgi:hypothetical protein